MLAWKPGAAGTRGRGRGGIAKELAVCRHLDGTFLPIGPDGFFKLEPGSTALWLD